MIGLNHRKKIRFINFIWMKDHHRQFFFPKGYANGFMNLKPDTLLTFYSDKTLKESSNDDLDV